MPEDERLRSRREVAHDANNFLTAKAGFAALLADGVDPAERVEANRRLLARAQAELEELALTALALGTISGREAAALTGEDLEVAVEAVARLRAGPRPDEAEER